MVKVECPSCSAPYSVSERRIPAKGLKMRCPKCSETFLVEKPGEGTAAASSRRGEMTMPGGSGAKPAAPRPKPRASDSPARRGQPTAAVGTLPELDAFGELEINLPTDNPPGADAGFDDLPGIPGAEAGFELEDDLPAPVAPRPRSGFDDDLPLPADASFDDLPAPGGRRSFDDDLPAPARPREKTRRGGFDDLPSPAPRRGGLDDDLPAPARGRGRGRGRGSLDDDLPAPARGGGGALDDLPAPRRGRGGDFDDLPAHRGDDLPMALEADLPMALEGDLPMALEGDLPLALDDGDLPGRHRNLPVPRGEADLPLALDDDGDLPLPADEGLPVPALHGDLPLPGENDLPLLDEHGDLPLPSDQNFPVASEFGDLPQAGTSGDAAIPIGEDGEPGPRESVGDEFAVEPAADEDSILEVDSDRRPAAEDGKDAPQVKIKKKRSGGKGVRIAMVALILLAVGGGMLQFTPLGPYGYFAISDALNAEDHAAALGALRTAAQKELAADTQQAAGKAVWRATNELVSRPRHTGTAAYAAFLGYAVSLRFGSDAGRESTAAQQLATIPPEKANEEALVALAKGAQLAVQGSLPAALGEAKRAGATLQGDVDVGVLQGEILIRMPDEAATAVEHWQQLVEAHPSARTRYGLARALQLADKTSEAVQAAQAALKDSPNHAGARVLIARARLQDDRKSDEALQLLEEVTEKGSQVRSAASKDELVVAFSLLGDAYLARSKTTAAEKAYAEAIALDPKSVRALVGNGELFFNAGRYSEALARFESASRVDPKNVGAVVGKAKTKLALEKPKDAKQVLLAAVKWTKHPLAGFQLGRAHEALGEYDEAEKAYRAAIEGAPKHPDLVFPYVQLAELLTARGRTEEAAEVLGKATEALPNNPRLYLSKGLVALKSGRLEDAKSELKAVLALEPENAFAMFQLAIAHRRAREFKEAEQLLDEVSELDPELAGLALERGLLFQASGKTDKALEMYEAALKKAPDDVDLKLRVASTQVISGLPRKALPMLRDVLQKRAQSAEVNHFYGRALLAIGDSPQEALRYLQNAVRYDANKADYHLFVAWAANELGRPSLAKESVEKALAIDQNMGDAYWQMGIVLQKEGKTRDALEELEKAVELNPSRHEAYATMARCFVDQLNYRRAEEAWRKAIEGREDNPEWHFRLGKILFDRGDKPGAVEHLSKSVDLLRERKQTPNWSWNVHFLLGEALRRSDPKRAVVAYKEFLRLAGPQNAYRADAERAVETLEGS